MDIFKIFTDDATVTAIVKYVELGVVVLSTIGIKEIFNYYISKRTPKNKQEAEQRLWDTYESGKTFLLQAAFEQYTGKKKPPPISIIRKLLAYNDNPIGAVIDYAKGGHFCELVKDKFHIMEPERLQKSKKLNIMAIISGVIILTIFATPMLLTLDNKNPRVPIAFICLYVIISIFVLPFLNGRSVQLEKIRAAERLAQNKHHREPADKETNTIEELSRINQTM